MVKNKFIAIAAAAALAAMLGLSACGGQASSSAASSSSGSSSAAASSSASASSAAADDTVISWQGVLTDGTLVDFISSDDGKHGGLVITKDSSQEPKRWVGDMTTTDDKATITDDTSKESISFTLTGFVKDGAMLVDIEGYGQGALVPMTAADWQMVAEAEELSKALDAKVNSISVFEDGTLMFYTENEEGTEGFVAILPKNATEWKTWSGKATTAADGKETVTDDKTGETFNYTWTKNSEDGTLSIEADGYGKAMGIEMTVADWMLLEELGKALDL